MTKAARTKIRIDSFGVGLDSLPRNQQRDHECVLNILRERKCFSAFEASAFPDIAKTITYLCSHRLTTDTESVGYPWIKVVAIDGVPLWETD